MTRDPFLLSATLRRDKVPDPESYPFTIPALRAFSSLSFHPAVTFFVGENGSGKSTLLEAIAVAAGMNAEGGSQNFNFSTRASHSELHLALRIARSARRPRSRYFLRAESFYNVSTQIERLGVLKSYGGTYEAKATLHVRALRPTHIAEKLHAYTTLRDVGSRCVAMGSVTVLPPAPPRHLRALRDRSRRASSAGSRRRGAGCPGRARPAPPSLLGRRGPRAHRGRVC
jgi:hypothetical protein